MPALVAVALLGMSLVACTPAPALTIPTEPTGPLMSGAPLSASDQTALFRLTLTSDRDRYRAGQTIQIGAELTYLGADAVTASGSGTLVGFGVASDAAGVNLEPIFTADCARHPFAAGDAVSYPFSKSGGGVAPNDPLAPFYQAYFSSPDLRLPAGTWTISAQTTIYPNPDCGGRPIGLSVSLKVGIEP